MVHNVHNLWSISNNLHISQYYNKLWAISCSGSFAPNGLQPTQISSTESAKVLNFLDKFFIQPDLLLGYCHVEFHMYNLEDE